MDRRNLLLATFSIACASSIPSWASATSLSPSNLTKWKVRSSEGFDALAFLGPLSGQELYRHYYAAEADTFAFRLPPAVKSDIAQLWDDAKKDGFGLLSPNLSVLLSTDGNDFTVNSLLAALNEPETRILPKYRASKYWNASDWAFFIASIPRLSTILRAMRDADFAIFRQNSIGSVLQQRIADVQRSVEHFDVISLQSKLTGRSFDPTIEVVLLQFSKPHGIRVQGQTFLQSFDYDTDTTVRIAAHEMLHPPVNMDGAAAHAALDVLGKDELIRKIVREHDPRWGYTSIEGMFNEDLVQALDQLICEASGVARNPADRWRKSDDGMHVLAGAFYGLLRDDRWIDTGGSIEDWLLRTTRSGRLGAASVHAVASRVLEREPGKLWPIDKVTG